MSSNGALVEPVVQERSDEFSIVLPPKEVSGELSDAATSLRDALKDPTMQQADIQKLVEKLDKSFTHFNSVEDELWKQVKQ